MSKKYIIAAISKNQRILITSHVNPDGDAIGSELALSFALKEMGKDVTICNRDAIPSDYHFLPMVKQIKLPDQLENNFDLLIVLDCGHINRVGAFTPADFKHVINIDHHATNQSFGDINWFRPHASCTGELVFELISALPVKITPEIATCVYTAVLTDTGSFHYANTSAKTFQLAARLVKYGAQPSAIAQAVYENMPLVKMFLVGQALKTLKLFSNGEIACIVTDQQMLDECNAQPEDTEDFVNYPRAIQGVKIAIFIREMAPDLYKISLRSKVNVDVAAIAEIFDGGGHVNAAGCRIRGSLEQVKQQLINSSKEALHELTIKESKNAES